VLRSLALTQIDHGIAIGRVHQAVNKSGTRIDLRLAEWPLEHVRWDATSETLETDTDAGRAVITHADGNWIVFQGLSETPWRFDACVLPAGFVWGAHAEALAHWNQSSKSHGLAKIVGELPEGSDLNDDDEEVTDLAAEFRDMIEALADGNSPIGIRPFGSKTDFVNNSSSAWQVFSKNVEGREKAAARIYLGTDAILGSVGGAPGVDISALFGVATTKIQGDFGMLERGINEGMLAPWCALNFGASLDAPTFTFEAPDPDSEKEHEQTAADYERLNATIERMRGQKLEVTQETVNVLARAFGIDPIPQLAAIEQQSATIVLAPTDAAKVIRTREARAAQGLAPLGDERDEQMLASLGGAQQ
jgi:hypothetical protein